MFEISLVDGIPFAKLKDAVYIKKKFYDIAAAVFLIS